MDRNEYNAVGRKVISDTLTKAMAERGATSAVYLSKTAAGLAAEIGEWGDGGTDAGPFVACTHENLSIALRWLIVQKRLAQADEGSVAQARAEISRRERETLDAVKCEQTPNARDNR